VLTRRGWLVTAGALALALAGRLLGVIELYVMAAGTWALVGVAMATVVGRPVRIEARRSLHPGHVQAGDESRVDLVVTNAGGPTPVLELRDPVGGGPRRARLFLAPLRPQQEERASYRVPTERRGVLEIGPLEAHRGDLFGLATAVTTVAGRTELVVFPPVEALLPLPRTPGDDRRAGARHPTAMGVAGEDFYALRPWQVGDDLRRVHWPSTARRDELMIRQHDVPWQGRATLVLDVRGRFHDDASLDRAVSVAASVLLACASAGSLVRLITTDGADSGFGTGRPHVDGLLERLARMEAADADLDGVLAVRSTGFGGTVALVATSDVAPGDLSRLARMGGQAGSLTLVVVERAGGRRATPVSGGATVVVGPEGRFAPAWNRVVGATQAGVR
jgi:uncharacterized protein (DUF58 family)